MTSGLSAAMAMVFLDLYHTEEVGTGKLDDATIEVVAVRKSFEAHAPWLGLLGRSPNCLRFFRHFASPSQVFHDFSTTGPTVRGLVA